MVKSVSVAVTLLYATTIVSGSRQTSPPVELNLVAPWSAPDPFLEIVEVVSKEKPTVYQALIPELTDIDRSSPLQQQYEEALALAAKYLDGPEELDIVKLNLAMHSAAPVIEAHHQYYNQTVVPSIKNFDPSCEVWAQVGSYQACSVEDLQAQLENTTPSELANNSNFTFNKLEHLFCNPCQGVPQVNVYTSSVNPTFTAFHRYLSSKINDQGTGTALYSLRYKPFSDPHSISPLYLTGYGVELALKNTDYMVIDDRSSSSTDNQQKDNGILESASFIKQQLGNLGKRVNQVLFDVDEPSTIEPLTPDEVKLLGLKATQFIMASNDPLSTLAQLSQDFPKYAHRISKITLNEDMVNEIMGNQRRLVKAGANAMWINGRKLEDDEINPFALARFLQKERLLIDSLVELGATKQQAIGILSSAPLSTDTSGAADGSLQDVYDVRVPEEDQVVLWWNDLEKDKRYSSWYPELSALLRPTYPGQMRAIRRNIYNVILVEDLASSRSLQRLTQEVQNMIKQGAPLRIGLVPYIHDQNSPSSLAAKSIHYLVQKYGKATGMSFLGQIQVRLANEGLDYATPSVISSAMEATEAAAKTPVVDIHLGWSDIMEQTHPSGIVRFLKRLGINRLGNDQGVLFLNGQYLEHNDEKPWTRVLMAAMNVQTQILTKSVYLGEINEDDNVYDFFLDQSHVSPARNPYVAVTENLPLRIPQKSGLKNGEGRHSYLQSGDDDSVTGNIWAIGNMNSPAGIKLALNAIEFIETNTEARLSIIHLPQAVDPKDGEEPEFSDLLYHELYNNNVNLQRVKNLLQLEWQHWQQHTVGDSDKEQHVMASKPLAPGSPIVDLAIRKSALSKWLTLGVGFVYTEEDKYLNYFAAEENEVRHCGVMVNGRVVGPFASDDDFTADDFNVLWQTEKAQRITPIMSALQQVGWTLDTRQSFVADQIMYIAAILNNDDSAATRNILTSQEDGSARERYYAQMDGTHSGTVINKGGDNGIYAEIGVLLDPTSEDAQKWSTILQVLSELKGVAIDIHWNPLPQLEELPLKRFYRYVLDSTWRFDDGSHSNNPQHQKRIRAPTAYFDDLPKDALYTLGVDTMDSWHVTVKEANVDLDNIQLTALDNAPPSSNRGVHAVYELERILVEGHCIDSVDQRPPRGLQFVLGTDSHPAMTDTIVMANLGYFQLKAQPGIYQLLVRPGRSSDVYGIESIGTHGKWTKSATTKDSSTKNLMLTSFEGLRLFPTVKKNPGMEAEDVLDDTATANQPQEKEGILSSLSHKLFGKKDDSGKAFLTTKQQADINIFSVASGHLYERFLAIMMASVMEHTDSTVKFWFIENFLSPSFKDFVPELSKRYGFDYEMVTYKWPSWLNAQKEKQRTIWGYKILFLDVLFPLDLEKVIFVDADQIVRTDLQELVDLDLHGAPYGYTPFCSDRHEMDGFRFWSQGYWKDHLRGRPYHISALYVVDLVRFRQMAAGDRLRAQYQQLSADPHSLANLDQDLPNNMIHSVPIFSLPQEWLWCETWCSDDSLKTAKTIDLCNNPLTKEPKLDRARRQVPEWETYDTQIEAIRQAFLQQKAGSSHVTLLSNDMDASPQPSIHVKDEL